MLYQRYANPKELLHSYIKRGRFGEFVSNFIESENNRIKKEAEKENERMLWEMYIHSYSELSFIDWKAEVLKNTSKRKHSSGDENLTDDDIQNIIEKTFSK